VLQRVKEDRNILQTIKRRMDIWISDILRCNCLLTQVIEGKIQERIKWWEDEEKDVSSYRMTLRKRGYTGN